MLSYLQEKHDAMVGLYKAHRESVLDLQDMLHREALPELVAQLDLDDRSLQWAREWIEDDGSIFRMLKKHNFSIPEASGALQQTLRWRISALRPFQANEAANAASFIQCLPRRTRDKLGRPVLLIQLARLEGASEEAKQEILRTYEAMRVHLHASPDRALQCVIMVDFKDATMRSMAVEFIPWFVREVAPRFPGMCGAVFMVNYSWAYSGMYNFVKRLLPSNVLARISFPTQQELLSYFDWDRLPREYGGNASLSLDSSSNCSSDSTCPTLTQLEPMDQDTRSPPPIHSASLTSYLPSTSLLNPYFGYPAVSNPGSSIPLLKNGRRRKRDLARTLTFLWLAKLKRTADRTWLWIIMTIILWVAGLRR